jgi:hypothetical protein
MTSWDGFALGALAMSVAWFLVAQITLSLGSTVPEPLVDRITSLIPVLWRPYLAVGILLGIADLLTIGIAVANRR